MVREGAIGGCLISGGGAAIGGCLVNGERVAIGGCLISGGGGAIGGCLVNGERGAIGGCLVSGGCQISGEGGAIGGCLASGVGGVLGGCLVSGEEGAIGGCLASGVGGFLGGCLVSGERVAIVDCGVPPPSVVNSESSYTTTTFGSMVTYTCHSGYKPDKPHANLTCLDTGYWDTPTFTCQKVSLPSLDMSNLAALSALFSGGGGSAGSAATNTNQNQLMTALLKNMQGLPGFPGMTQAPPTPTPTTTPKPSPTSHLPMGFQLPSHLQSLLPNGLSNAQGFKSNDLMTLASLGLGSGTPAAAPRDISQLIGSMNPMSILGPAMGLPMPGTGAASAGGPAAAPIEPEKMVEQREEMMMRAMMANAMKSMMQPRTPTNGNGTAQARPNNNNAAMEMMTLMALQSGLGGAGATSGGSGGSGFDPMAMMLGGMNVGHGSCGEAVEEVLVDYLVVYLEVRKATRQRSKFRRTLQVTLIHLILQLIPAPYHHGKASSVLRHTGSVIRHTNVFNMVVLFYFTLCSYYYVSRSQYKICRLNTLCLFVGLHLLFLLV
ncbi:hypothetical protein Btru_044350 [Bulinus truncatus]|nr:hypothetical protein Btru_044350 [Bulinus truncatus]